MKKDNEQHSSPKPADTPQLGVFDVSNQRELLINFKNYLRDERDDAVSFDWWNTDELVDDFLKIN